MSIYLVQHAHALSKTEDPERPISARGRAHASRIADVAAGYRVPVARIAHSAKLRARQTAEIFAERLAPAGGVEAREGLRPNDDVSAVADALDPASGLMLVGHLPFIERLAGLLVTGQPERIFKVQGGGVVCLDRDEVGWHIRWALMPEVG